LEAASRDCESHHIIDFFAMARRLLKNSRGENNPSLRSSTMLPAIGASLVLDAIQSLTSPQSSSQSVGSGGFDVGDSSGAASTAPATVAGFSTTQISSDNLNALIDAQSLASGDLASALGPDTSASDSSQSGAASSAYNAVNQLAQSTAIPVGLSVSA
jgi:hypothetical protein